jgi:hypothetical protein
MLDYLLLLYLLHYNNGVTLPEKKLYCLVASPASLIHISLHIFFQTKSWVPEGGEIFVDRVVIRIKRVQSVLNFS